MVPAQVDPETFALNMFLLIGAAILLGLMGICLVALWTALNSVIWLVRRRLAERVHRRLTFRADGKRYPGFMEGVCGQCHRGDRKIYYPPGTDKELCPRCYERYWRREERSRPEDDPVGAASA